MDTFHGVPTVDKCIAVSQWIDTESGADSRAELHLLCWKAGCDMGGADERSLTENAAVNVISSRRDSPPGT